MHAVEIAFWIFFAGVAAWVAWGFISVFFGIYRDRVPREPRRSGASGTGSWSAGETFAAGGMTSMDTGFDSGSDIGGSDSGGGDSGGGGDYSGGGGDFGGGGSSGGW